MTHETKTEVVIFTGLAAFLIALWWINRSNGGGTGLEDQGLPGFPSAASASLPGQGDASFNIGGDTYNLGSTPNGASSCGCPTCPESNNIIAFGSNEDLAQYVNSLPGLISNLTAALQPGGSY